MHLPSVICWCFAWICVAVTTAAAWCAIRTRSDTALGVALGFAIGGGGLVLLGTSLW